LRVVWVTDKYKCSEFLSNASTKVVFPHPEGAAMMNKLDIS